MRTIISTIALAVSLLASAQEMHFKGTQGLFNKSMAMSEMVGLQNTFDENNNPIIIMESRNGAKYSCPAKDVEIDVTPRSLASKNSKYHTLIETVRRYDNIDELEFGDFIGVGEKTDYSFDEYVEAFYWLSQYVGKDLAATMKPYLKLNTALLGMKNMVKQENIRVQVYDIVYVGVDSRGQKTPFSARFIWPYDANENNLIKLTNIYVDNHATVITKGMEPSNMFWAFSAQPVLSKGYFVVQPDLIGFGATAGYSQQYIDKDINGADVAYSIVAAQQFIDWFQENKKEHGFRMDANAPVINSGASQGATTAMAGTYYIENCMDKEKYNINLKETHVCSGGYDMAYSMDFFANQDILDYPIKVPAFFIGLAAAHPELLRDGDKQLTLNDYFQPSAEYFHYIEDGVDYGNFWQTMDLLIDNRLVQVVCSYAFWDEAAGGPSIRTMLTHDQLNEDLHSINWNAPKMKGVKSFLDANNMCDPNIWKPVAPVKLYTTPNDITVPAQNSYNFYGNMYPYNQEITLDITKDLPEIFPPEMGYGDHMTLCFIWYIAEMTGIDISIVNEIVKAAMNGNEEKALDMAKRALIKNTPEAAKAFANIEETY